MKRKSILGKLIGSICLVSIIFGLLSGCSSAGTTNSSANPAGSIASTKTSSAVNPISSPTMPTTTEKVTFSVVSSTGTVKPGDNFDISIRITTDQPSRGAQFSLKWDPAKVECIAVKQGLFFKDFAESNGADLFLLPSDKPIADNVAGTFPKTNDPKKRMMIAMHGGIRDGDGKAAGVTGTGDIFILQMLAKAGSKGPVDFLLSEVLLGDNGEDISKDLKPAVISGKIIIAP